MSDSVTDFYDRLGPVFHHNMGYDWEAGVRWEGEWLDHFLSGSRFRRLAGARYAIRSKRAFGLGGGAEAGREDLGRLG